MDKKQEQNSRPVIDSSDPIPDNSYRDRWDAPGGENPDTDDTTDKPIPEAIYPVLDTDLARDNVENHISAADLQDL